MDVIWRGGAGGEEGDWHISLIGGGRGRMLPGGGGLEGDWLVGLEDKGGGELVGRGGGGGGGGVAWGTAALE